MSEAAAIPSDGQKTSWRASIHPYLEKAPLAAFFVGVSSGFPYAMIGATLTTRLAQDGITKNEGDCCVDEKDQAGDEPG